MAGKITSLRGIPHESFISFNFNLTVYISDLVKCCTIIYIYTSSILWFCSHPVVIHTCINTSNNIGCIIYKYFKDSTKMMIKFPQLFEIADHYILKPVLCFHWTFIYMIFLVYHTFQPI